MLQVFVQDDLVKVGVTEDGEDDIARAFYVVAEDASGRRWAHSSSYVAHRRDAEVAEACAVRLRDRVAEAVAEGRSPDFDSHWNEIDPAYGSEAYQGLDGLGYFRARERFEAFEAGERGVGFGSELADSFFA